MSSFTIITIIIIIIIIIIIMFLWTFAVWNKIRLIDWKDLFHALAAATRNARSSSDDLLVGRTTSAGELDDLRRCLGSIWATCWGWSDRKASL